MNRLSSLYDEGGYTIPMIVTLNGCNASIVNVNNLILIVLSLLYWQYASVLLIWQLKLFWLSYEL